MRDVIPLPEAAAAAAGGGVLGEEDGVTLHRRLFAVIGNVCGREAGADEVFRVGADGVHPYFLDIGDVLRGEVEARTERGSRESREGFFRGHNRDKKRRV